MTDQEKDDLKLFAEKVDKLREQIYDAVTEGGYADGWASDLSLTKEQCAIIISCIDLATK
jgi:hypothetical protein